MQIIVGKSMKHYYKRGGGEAEMDTDMPPLVCIIEKLCYL